jgi:hypothetical protein
VSGLLFNKEKFRQSRGFESLSKWRRELKFRWINKAE